jgi:polyadenylate-binding protein
MTTPYASASLYVGDLHPDVTEALLFEIFNSVGPVASIRVCRDVVTRRSLGYAYVNFHNVLDAERALDTLNYTAIKGVPCRIMWSHRDPTLRKSGAGNIFVKNLDKIVDNKALYDTFSIFGNILSCKVATDETGQSRGYGFVHYESEESAKNAIAKVNGMLIGQKKVYVGPFVRKQDRSVPGDNVRFTNVFVKNIPEDTDDDGLKTMMGKYGEVQSAVVMKDENNKPRGFGFANFSEPESAKAAVEDLNGKEMNGKTVFCGRAQKKAERESELRAKFEAMKMERQQKYQGVNLYVKNLDDQVDDDKLREEFSKFGAITSARIMKDEKAQSRGFGFVCFSAPDEATKAVTEMNGKLLNGKPLYVALAQRKDVRRAHLEAHYSSRVGSNNMRMQPGMPQPQMYPGQPMYFPNGMPQPRPQGFMYAQQMMPRAPWRPQAPQQGGRPGYPVPNYVVPVPQRQQRGGRGAGQPRPQGPGAGAPMNGPSNGPVAGGAAAQNRRYKYTPNARNRADQPTQAPNGQPSMPQMPGMSSGPLDPRTLAAASPQEQKQMLGERLFPLIHGLQPALAGKITGMLLEMSNDELLILLESSEELHSKVQEAVQVLEAHGAVAAAQEQEAMAVHA